MEDAASSLHEVAGTSEPDEAAEEAADEGEDELDEDEDVATQK